MQYEVIYHGSLDGMPEIRQAMESVVEQLKLESVPLPGTLRVEWKKSFVRRGDFVAHLEWPAHVSQRNWPTVPSGRNVWITKDQLLNDEFSEIQRKFNSALSHFYLWQSRALLREVEESLQETAEAAT